MAKRRRVRRHRRGRRSRLTGGRLAVGAAIVLALGYFVFTRLLFDPFEQSQPAFELLVPRDVDLYLHRSGLAGDFDSLPTPRFVQQMVRTPEWKEFATSDLYQGWEWPEALESFAAELEPQIADAPLDILQDVLGTEVAVVARGLGGAPRYALLARLSTKGKLAVASLNVGGVMEKVMPGAVVETIFDDGVPDGEYYELAPQEGDALYFKRAADLFVVGQDEDLVRDILTLVVEGSQRSLGLTRLWGDHVPVPADAGARYPFGLDFSVAGAELVELFELGDDGSERQRDALANILPRVIDTTLIEDAVGRLELNDGVLGLRAYAELDATRTANNTGGLQGEEAFVVHERLLDVMGLLPTDVAAVITMNVDLQRLLDTVVNGLDPELVGLINTTLRDVSRYKPGWQVDNVPALVGYLTRLAGDRLTVAIRPRYNPAPEGLQPVPNIAFILPMRDPDAWTELNDAIVRGHRVLGINPKQMWQQKVGGVGLQTWYGLAGMAVTHFAHIVLDQETLVIATDNELLEEIVRVYTYSGRQPALASKPEVRDLIDHFKGPIRPASANIAAWIGSTPLQTLLDPYGEYLGDVETLLDFGVLRVQLRNEVVSREYPGQRWDDLAEDVQAAIDERLDEQLDERERNRVETLIPAFAEEWRDGFSWLGVMQQGVVALRLGDRSLSIDGYVQTPLSR